MTGSDQQEIIDFLENAAFDQPVMRIDTANAHVFLAGDHAYKIKRPVRYSFLDFSTREARRLALAHELELNRRTAADLYEAVAPITRDEHGLTIDGRGEPVEWLLIMRRFPDGALLAEIAQERELPRVLLDRLAAAIAAFHRSAEPVPNVGAAAFKQVIEGNTQDLERSVPKIFMPDRVETLARQTMRAFAVREEMLDARARAGMVRHCHGDLHMANIVVLDEQPVLFDCVEFNDEFARIDLLYDVAYLVMDLIEKGHRPAAQYVLNAYNQRLTADAALALMPLFLSVRAAIRAKLNGFQGNVAEANRYLDLALAALAEVPPCLIAIGGRSGTGKSTMAMALAPEIGAMPGAMVLRSDVIRKALFGLEATEKLPDEAYRPDFSVKVFGIIAERAKTLLSAGRTVIADAVFGSAAEREQIASAARDAGVPFRPVWLVADEGILEARVTARQGDASDADAVIVRRQRALDKAEVAWPKVQTDGDVADAIERVRVALGLPPTT
ncbi:MAG: AAA family ATPase [Pseudomonadota bacterium]